MTETDVDAATLEARLSAVLDAAVVGTEVLHDGLNLTVGISTEDGERSTNDGGGSTGDDGYDYVLRRPNKLRHTDLFNDLRAEYELLERLREADLPTPVPAAYCDDASVLGEPFFVTTHLDGRAIPMGSELADRFPTPRARNGVASGLIDTLATVHSLDPERFEDVCTRQSPLDQVDHALERLDRVRSVTGRDTARLREVADWLRENAPSDSPTALVHGDFKPGNVLFDGGDDPAVTGVLDWETAMLGDPGTELGYLLLYWRDEGDPTPSLDDFEARNANDAGIEDVREIDENGFYPFTTLPGSPTRRDLVDRYEDATGIVFEHDRFYRAHAALMLATVWEDLHRHQVDADAASDYVPLAEYMSLVAADIVSGERPL